MYRQFIITDNQPSVEVDHLLAGNNISQITEQNRVNQYNNQEGL